MVIYILWWNRFYGICASSLVRGERGSLWRVQSSVVISSLRSTRLECSPIVKQRLDFSFRSAVFLGCLSIFGSVISSNHTRSIDAGYFYECLNIACSVGLCVIIGPIPWGHSSPLCHALSSSLSLLSLSWTSMRRRHATVPLATSDEMAWGGSLWRIGPTFFNCFLLSLLLLPFLPWCFKGYYFCYY